MTTMQRQDLSSNWRALQAKLQSDGPPPKKRKREAPAGNDGPRRRQRPRPAAKPRAPSSRASSARAMPDPPSQSGARSGPADLAAWALENDVVLPGSASAKTALPHLSTFTDAPNAGLSPASPAGKLVALDCEMVGGGDPKLVAPGSADERSVLARASLVDYHGRQIYDSFVQPVLRSREVVTDWRTQVSGVSERDMATARPFEAVRADVAALLAGRLLVGHALRNDLDALQLDHPRIHTRDTSRHPPFRKAAGGRPPALKRLAREVLGWEIQAGKHSSVRTLPSSCGLSCPVLPCPTLPIRAACLRGLC